MGVLGGYNRESFETANRLGGLQGNSNPREVGHNDQYDALIESQGRTFLVMGG